MSRPSREELRLIGCSDFPALLGLKEPGPVGLYNRTRHGIGTPVAPELEAMGELGRLTEWPTAIVAARKLRIPEARLEKVETIVHPGGREWQRYSLDPIVRDPPTVLEVKARESWRMRAEGWGEPGSDEVPLPVFAQVQGQLEALRADRDRWVGTELPDVDQVVVAVLVGGQRVDLYFVPRAEEQGAALAERAERFWTDHVVAGRPPFMDHFEGSAHYLRTTFRERSTAVRPAEPHELEAAREYLRLDAAIKRLERERDTVENELAEYVGAAGGLEGGAIRIRFREQKGRVREKDVVDVLAQRLGLTPAELAGMREFHRGAPYRVIDARGP